MLSYHLRRALGQVILLALLALGFLAGAVSLILKWALRPDCQTTLTYLT